MTVEELAKDLFNAMSETFQASERAGLSAHDSWGKGVVRLKARCIWLAKQHGDELVGRAMEIVNAQFKAAREKGKEKP